MPSKLIRTAIYTQHWYFCCESCGAEGDMELDSRDGMKPFECPEGCGAVYVPHGGNLICVVKVCKEITDLSGIPIVE